MNKRTVENPDIIIIGAGIGGLSAAAFLAKAGMRVLVLEQDDHVGGTANVFRHKGFTFPAGPLSVTMPDYIADTICQLGAEPPCFIRDHFQVRRGSMDVMISVPLRELEKQLKENFPEEHRGIHAVIGILDDVIASLDLLQPSYINKVPPGNADVIERWGGIPARDFLDRHLKDEVLKDLLGSQGTAKAEMSVALLATMWRFMSKEGIWYIKGGIGKLAELLGEQVRAYGGEIRYCERVESIIVHDGVAAGVELADGVMISSRNVISDADYKETFLKLLPPGAINAIEREKISRMPLTSSAFTVFLGVWKDMVDLGAFRGHHLLIKPVEGDPVPWNQKRPVPEDFLQDEIWLSWWSKHDHGLAPPGCEALMIKVTAPYDHFIRYSGDRYYSMKEEMADALVSAISRVIPGLPEAAVVREVATPLTYKKQGHRTEGSVAGWSWRSGDHPEPRSLTVTPVQGLLMVGLQSFTRLFYGGMGTSLYSGRYAAEIVLSSI